MAVELVIVPDARAAGANGFGPSSTRYFGDVTLVAWWPALGAEWLRGRDFSRVTVLDAFGLDERARAAARMQLRVEPKLWLER